MAVGFEIASFIVEVISVFKRNDSSWRDEALDEILEMKRRKLVTEENIKGEINKVKEKNRGELERERLRQQSLTKDYGDFLKSLEEMKTDIIDTFVAVQKPMALLIYSHGKRLLDTMYQQDEEHMRKLSEMKFVNFMITYHEDRTILLNTKNDQMLPQKMLEIISSSEF